MTKKELLERYVKDAQDIIEKHDKEAARDFVENALSTFPDECRGLSWHLTRTCHGVVSGFDTGRTVSANNRDDIKDLKLTKARLEAAAAEMEGKAMDGNNTINVNGGSGIQIQQNTIASTQQQSVNAEFDFDKAQKTVDSILKYRDVFEGEFGDKKDELIQAIDSANEAIQQKDHIKLKSAWNWIKDVASGVAGGVIAQGIISLLTQAPV